MWAERESDTMTIDQPSIMGEDVERWLGSIIRVHFHGKEGGELVGIEDETSVDILIHKYNLCSYALGHGFVLLTFFCLFNTPAAAAAFALTRYHFCSEFPYHNPILFWYLCIFVFSLFVYSLIHIHAYSLTVIRTFANYMFIIKKNRMKICLDCLLFYFPF